MADTLNFVSWSPEPGANTLVSFPAAQMVANGDCSSRNKYNDQKHPRGLGSRELTGVMCVGRKWSSLPFRSLWTRGLIVPFTVD